MRLGVRVWLLGSSKLFKKDTKLLKHENVYTTWGINKWKKKPMDRKGHTTHFSYLLPP